MYTIFANRTVYIATMHGKEQVISPLLTTEFLCPCVLVEGIDTDQFGTFTWEKKRIGDMLYTARAKIHHAIQLTGADLVIASEWSFWPYTPFPLIHENFELTLLYDRINNREITGHFRTCKTNLQWSYITSVDEALQFAESIWFPDHGIVVRRSKDGTHWIYKDITSVEALIDSIEKLLKPRWVTSLYLETDMRAHKNPTRMHAIAASTKNLIQAAQSLCPRCQRPWFVVTGYDGFRLCSWCKNLTDVASHTSKRCQWCCYEERREIILESPYADPAHCSVCNP